MHTDSAPLGSLGPLSLPFIWSTEPAPPLREFVDRIWGMAIHSESPLALPRLLPGTGAEIHIHLGPPFRQLSDSGEESPLPEAYLLALRCLSVNLAPAREIDFVAIRFKAGCASRFLDCPLTKCLDRPLALTEVLGPAAARLMDSLRLDRTRPGRITSIQDFLLRRLGEPSRLDTRTTWATQSLYYRPSGIQGLADRLGLARRQLERCFKAQEGVSPVAFRQLARFQRTARKLRLEPTLALAQAGADFGFADQAHMTREFRAIVRQTPEQLRNEMLNRLTFYCPSMPKPPNPSSAR
jgi:AraC-like DNA-binding protein